MTTSARATTEESRRRWLAATWLPIAAVLTATAWGSNQFTPMLLVYHQTLGLGTGTLEALFGVYALGLIPGLLIGGPLSDALGRRRVVIPAAGLSLAASVALVAAGRGPALLFVGRLLAGVSAGAVFGSGTAWLREILLRETSPRGASPARDHAAATRAVVAMTAGFALGPLVAGVLAQWSPDPGVVPYLPHIALMIVVLALLSEAPETVAIGQRRRVSLALPGVGNARFRRVVTPMAPWVFAAPAVAFALLPSIVGAQRATDGIGLVAAITALCALAGVLVQPLARRLDVRAGGNRAATTGLLVLVVGLVLGAEAAHAHQSWLLVPCAIVLGAAYGLCLVAGLVEIQRMAGPDGLAGLTAAYYTLTYLGFAVPYVLTLGSHVAGYPLLLAITAALALGTALRVRLTSAQAPA